MRNDVKFILFCFLALVNNLSYSALKQTFVEKNTEIVIEVGNIVNSPTQAVVNAANEDLVDGGGVCGAIFKAAGKELLQSACNKFPVKNGVRCQKGEAQITESFNLQQVGIEYIIHAVGPDCRIIKDSRIQDTLLANTYKNSLVLADKHKISSITFPFISSGIYRFPKERAAKIAIQTILNYIKNSTNIISIRIIVMTHQDFELFCKTVNDSI